MQLSHTTQLQLKKTLKLFTLKLSMLKERFGEPSFIIFSNAEQLLLKSINGESYQKEYGDFVSVYADDIKTTALPSNLLILRIIFESLEPVHFGDIVWKLKIISL